MQAADPDRQPMPPHDAHAHAGHSVRLDITHPPIDDLGVRVERLDSARVHAPLEILLRLLVRERPAGDGPERAAHGEGHDAREGYAERGGRVGREVRRELDRLGLVGPELDRGDGDAVGARVSVCLEDAPSVDDFCVPFALFGVYAYTSQCFDRCFCRRGSSGGSGGGGGGGGGGLRLWVGWGTGKTLLMKTPRLFTAAWTHVEDSEASEAFCVLLLDASSFVLTEILGKG